MSIFIGTLLAIIGCYHSDNLWRLTVETGIFGTPERDVRISDNRIHLLHYTFSKTIRYGILLVIYVQAIHYLGESWNVNPWITDVTVGLILLDGLRMTLFKRVSCLDILDSVDLKKATKGETQIIGIELDAISNKPFRNITTLYLPDGKSIITNIRVTPSNVSTKRRIK